MSDLYIRGGDGADKCLCRTGSLPAKWPISGRLLQSLAGMESPRMGVRGAGEPFFWLSGRTRSEEGFPASAAAE